jgi:sugar lactone lactonase YvrE
MVEIKVSMGRIMNSKKKYFMILIWIEMAIFLSSEMIGCASNKNPLASAPPYVFMYQLGAGSIPSQVIGSFQDPLGLMVDPNGLLFVADSGGQGVEVFSLTSTSANYSTFWSASGPVTYSFPASPLNVSWDQATTTVLVTEGPTTTGTQPPVINFSSNGSYQSSISVTGMGYAAAIAEDKSGNFWIADASNHSIWELSPQFQPVTEYDASNGYNFGTTNPANTYGGPLGLAIYNKYLYVADTGKNRILEYQLPAMTPVTQWGGSSQFNAPYGITVDSSGNVYVVDCLNDRIEIFSSTGTLKTIFGSSGSSPGQFIDPTYIAVDNFGNIYVSDSGNNRIEVFKPNG